MRYSRSLTLILCMVVAVGVYQAHGQVPQGQVLGTVTDSTGAIIDGATVRLENELTGVGDTQVTGASGTFTFSYLNSGVYRLSVEKAGFKTGVYPGIKVEVQEKKTS